MTPTTSESREKQARLQVGIGRCGMPTPERSRSPGRDRRTLITRCGEHSLFDQRHSLFWPERFPVPVSGHSLFVRNRGNGG